MSKARLVITAVMLEGRPVAEVAATYGVSRSWLYELLARYRDEGEAAFQPRSRAPKTSPTATAPATVEAVLALRAQLTAAGHDAGPDTIVWHLHHHHRIQVSRATIHRILTRAGAITAAPRKRPKSSYIRFQAAMPNECWQSDFTHYPLTDTRRFPKGIEIMGLNRVRLTPDLWGLGSAGRMSSCRRPIRRSSARTWCVSPVRAS